VKNKDSGWLSVLCRFAAGATASESRRLLEPRWVLTVLLDAMAKVWILEIGFGDFGEGEDELERFCG